MLAYLLPFPWGWSNALDWIALGIGPGVVGFAYGLIETRIQRKRRCDVVLESVKSND